jgi:hypothetical protein
VAELFFVDACAILIGEVRIPLKRGEVVLLSGTFQSTNMSLTLPLLPVRQLIAPHRRAIAPDSGRDSVAPLLVGSGRRTKGSQGQAGRGVREMVGGHPGGW